MAFQDIKYILFDAANTLIHKPDLWSSILRVLDKYGYNVPVDKLQVNHKILSEATSFPDRTSKEFYAAFNTELLLSLGILPQGDILNEVFTACSYLPWQRFNDTDWLNNSPVPIGVLSNFNSSLTGILEKLFGNIFSHIIVSETQKIRKPDIAFYDRSLTEIGIPANKILYVGDSLKLDILPAKKMRYSYCLIDRLNFYEQFKQRVTSLQEIKTLIGGI